MLLSPLRGGSWDEAAPAATGVLDIRSVSKRFGVRAPVLDDVSFSAQAGEAVALIGPNGAGKSTLLRCCLRLVEPSGGAIRLFDAEVTTLRPAALRRIRARVGFVFQRHNLVPRLSALSNVLHGALARGEGPRVWFQSIAPARLRAEALERLDRVGLADLAARPVMQMSGGQSQRVAIARALMQRPEIVFADEPAASLDPAAGQEVMAVFRSLVEREKLTLVFTSHDLRHATEFAHAIVGLKAGRVAVRVRTTATDALALRSLYE